MLLVNFEPILLCNLTENQTHNVMAVLHQNMPIFHAERIHVWMRMEDAAKCLVGMLLSFDIVQAIREYGHRAMAENCEITRAIGIETHALNDALKRLSYLRLPIGDWRKLFKWFLRRRIFLEKTKQRKYLLKANSD